ncbi:hypothetical protein COO60DRAFT_562672 [Scenedesmus sp. NREL 46B-D3]|nr:hypothetical protein COO60DRAFT_562672 [Scenedesmus sp. NREL 46B-D3]
MAHCPGDEAGTWLVLAILQGSAGEFKGEKAPYMELIARRSWTEQQQQQQQMDSGDPTAAGHTEGRGAAAPRAAAAAAAGAAAAAAHGDRWMFYKQTNQLPGNGAAEALVGLLQQHVPELLLDAEGDDSAGQQGVMGRQVCFNWATPCFEGSGSCDAGSSSSSWYVDLLTPAVERLGSSTTGGSSSSSRSSTAGAAAGGNAGRRAAQQQLSLLPPGVFRMDDYLEQQRELRSREDARRQQQQLERERLRGNSI